MIRFFTDSNNAFDIEDYSTACTLKELDESINRLLLERDSCKKCGRCCHDLIPLNGVEVNNIFQAMEASSDENIPPYLSMPEKPNIQKKKKAIEEMKHIFKLPLKTATALYEYNNSEPICIAKNGNGNCTYNSTGLCTKYHERPLVCRLYHCNFGSRLSKINNIIISQGTWHSYFIMGWIDIKDIEYNPFLKSANSEDILLKEFDHDFPDLDDSAAYLL